MGEVGLDEDGLEAGELLEAAVQEYHVHDVVADVPLSLDLEGEEIVGLQGLAKEWFTQPRKHYLAHLYALI